MKKFSEGYPNASMNFYWKDIAMLIPQEFDKLLYIDFAAKESELKVYSDSYSPVVTARTVTTTAPPPEAGFDLSAELANILKCGGETPQSTYCPQFFEKCIEGSCVEISYGPGPEPPTPTACVSHQECPENYICVTQICQQQPCSVTCPLGTKCNTATNLCTPLANADECTDNDQCATGLACLEDTVAGYNTCQEPAPVVVPECDTDADCLENFVCASMKLCIPKIQGFDNGNISANNQTPGVSSTKLNIATTITWNKVQDKDGNDINDYNLLATYTYNNSVFQKQEYLVNDVTNDPTITKTFNLFIKGDVQEQTVTIKVWPGIDGLNETDIDKVAGKAEALLKNDIHCMLGAAGENKCPSTPLYQYLYKWICEDKVCKQKPITLQPPIVIPATPTLPLIPFTPYMSPETP